MASLLPALDTGEKHKQSLFDLFDSKVALGSISKVGAYFMSWTNNTT